MISAAILLRGLIAALIVGFVTASIKSWIDRVFLVIMLVGIVGLPIDEAIIVNLVVVALAALLMVLRQRKMLSTTVPAGRAEWLLIVIPAFLGGVAGRLIATSLNPSILLIPLGSYAILVGLRIFFIKPLAERETKAHRLWLAPVGLGSGLLAGLISAGGKPFAVPAYNNAMGHHPQRAYAFASLGVVAATWAALLTQATLVALPSLDSLLLALYEFVLVTIVALFVSRLWSERLNKIVNLAISPILIIVGIRFFLLGLTGGN